MKLPYPLLQLPHRCKRPSEGPPVKMSLTPSDRGCGAEQQKESGPGFTWLLSSGPISSEKQKTKQCEEHTTRWKDKGLRGITRHLRSL